MGRKIRGLELIRGLEQLAQYYLGRPTIGLGAAGDSQRLEIRDRPASKLKNGHTT